MSASSGGTENSRRLSQTLSWVYARKIRNRLELAVRFTLIAYAAKMDAVLGRMVHLKSISSSRKRRHKRLLP